MFDVIKIDGGDNWDNVGSDSWYGSYETLALAMEAVTQAKLDDLDWPESNYQYKIVVVTEYYRSF